MPYKDKNKRIEYQRIRRKTKLGRAATLIHKYEQSDIKYNRGKGDLTPQWIVENIFSKPCAHCGETDWTKIGCNRLDNSKPHTMDNVEPCCKECNDKLGCEYKQQLMSKSKIYQFTLDGQLVGVFESPRDAAKHNNFKSHTPIRKCADGIIHFNTYMGYKWSRSPM